MKLNNLHTRSLSVLLFIALLGGCAGVADQFKRHYKESNESYYAPENLGTDAENTGLLLVDGIKKVTLNNMPISGLSIANVDDPENFILVGSFKTGGIFSPRSGVVVVPNLIPGIYRIIKIKFDNTRMWETLYMPKTKDYEINIVAGNPAYFGRIEVEHPMGTTNRIIKLKYDKIREIESWNLVTEKFKDSPWINVINSHANKLKQ